LFEKYKEADEEINDADQVDVQNTWRPLVDPGNAVEVGPVFPGFGRIRRPLYQVVQLAGDARLLEIHVDVSSSSEFVRLASAVEADAHQPIARK